MPDLRVVPRDERVLQDKLAVNVRVGDQEVQQDVTHEEEVGANLGRRARARAREE